MKIIAISVLSLVLTQNVFARSVQTMAKMLNTAEVQNIGKLQEVVYKLKLHDVKRVGEVQDCDGECGKYILVFVHPSDSFNRATFSVTYQENLDATGDLTPTVILESMASKLPIRVSPGWNPDAPTKKGQ